MPSFHIGGLGGHGALGLLVGENSPLASDLALHMRSFPVKLARERAALGGGQFHSLAEGIPQLIENM